MSMLFKRNDHEQLSSQENVTPKLKNDTRKIESHKIINSEKLKKKVKVGLV